LPHHALVDVPAQALVLADLALEGARRARQDRLDQDAVGMRADILHACTDTPRRRSVASGVCNRQRHRRISGIERLHPHRGNPINLEILIPNSLFVCITYAIKLVMDARVRRQMVSAGGSEELVGSILRSEELRQRHSSLRWGIILVALGLGFGLIQWAGWEDVTPGLVAVLVGATGLGNLVFFAISRRLA
jgi:hypothetical protein